MKPTVTFIILLLFIAVPVFADCDHPESLFESKSCMYEEFISLNNQVDISYKVALKSLAVQAENKQNLETAKRKLILAQKTWRIFRDQDCAVYGALYFGNNNAGQFELQCKIDLTKQRISQLNEFK